ncbi:sacsin-like, partial [Poecilia reticulata]|uniref:sacsin-like n=1 Tax=Poecilia reticulata TaxID=8081 RepID=UPI0007E953F9
IPRPMAIHFGIKTTRHHTLEDCTVDNFFPFSFHFEQREQLTVRIKNIISAYPSKKDILKELIQNADDAEATEIHFIWDKRQHGKERTFGKSWNNLQGPALCVFNNKVFSDDDLKGIQQLGEGGKQNLQGKIGKYGIGFNSVYHLTDCPSILTGDTFLCISDPTQKYIEIISDRPRHGIGYNLTEEFKEMCLDVYKSFLPDQFTLEAGTMFRLPLRTSVNAENSELSQQNVTDEDMIELFSALSEDPEGLTLFLKNICKIKVHVIDEHSEILQTIFMVEKTLSQESEGKKNQFTKHLDIALESEKPATPCHVLYEITISTSDKRHSDWIIAEQFGSFKHAQLKMANKLLQGAIAARVNSNSSPPSRFSNNDFQGAAFCSLPLPGKTGLPVHVNGNFEVDSSRKNLWKEDGQNLKSHWNEMLKKIIIAPLYADLLDFIKRKVIGGSRLLSITYLSFWPIVSKNVGPEWHEMILEVYRAIKEKCLYVIPVLRTSKERGESQGCKENSPDWCSLRETEPMKAPYLTDSKSERINPILGDVGMNLVHGSASMCKIWSTIQKAGIEVRVVCPASVRTFLCAKPLNDPTETDNDLPLPLTDTLIEDEQRCSELLKFCLNDSRLWENAENDSTLLDGLPLLLTKDKVLRKFNSKTPKLFSRYDDLFLGCEDRFADYTVNTQCFDILESFNLVKKLTLPDGAKFLIPIIESQLSRHCEVDADSGLYVPNETILKWLELLWRFIASEIKYETFSASKKSLTLGDVRELFIDCSILLVVCPRLNNKSLLQTMKCMPNVILNASENDISHILFKLGFMRLNLFFYKTIQITFSDAELLDTNDKSLVLNRICNINQSEFSQLSNDDLRTLQSFLQSGITKSKSQKDYERKLRSLPIFETALGKRTRIDGPKKIFLLNSRYSATFPDLFTLSNSNNIFLKSNPENQALSKLLDMKILSDLKYFMKFILPFVQTLTEEDTLECLKLILILQHKLSFLKHKERIVSSMKSVRLIRSFCGDLQTASYYYDDSVELYRRMVPRERFVPDTFWTKLCEEQQHLTRQARNLVRELGMKHEVTEKDIIKFARELESEAKENHERGLKLKSAFLFREALKYVSIDNGERLLRSIANIKFIYPVKIQEDLCNYHQPFASENTTVSIKGSLIETYPKHQELIWSSMPVIDLPDCHSEWILNLMKKVGAHKQPPSEKVTSNMRNICQSPCKTEEVTKIRADVFRRAYAYLQANCFDGQSLYGQPVVLVEKDTVLFKADSVCLSLSDELEFRPYLYPISSQDALYAEFFKKVGVKEEATAEHYCNVLAAVYADSRKKQQLNANQLITIKRAVH